MNENIPWRINRNKRKEGANRKLVKKDSIYKKYEELYLHAIDHVKF